MRFLACLLCFCLLTSAVTAEEKQTFTVAIKAVSVRNGITEAIETKLIGNKTEGVRSTFASAKMKYACSIQPVVSDKIPAAEPQYIVAFKISDGAVDIASPRLVITAGKLGEIAIEREGGDSLRIQTEITE